MKRNEKRENHLGDLGSLIDEISSRGTSICSDDINRLSSPIKQIPVMSPSQQQQQPHQQQYNSGQGGLHPYIFFTNYIRLCSHYIFDRCLLLQKSIQ